MEKVCFSKNPHNFISTLKYYGCCMDEESSSMSSKDYLIFYCTIICWLCYAFHCKFPSMLGWWELWKQRIIGIFPLNPTCELLRRIKALYESRCLIKYSWVNQFFSECLLKLGDIHVNDYQRIIVVYPLVMENISWGSHVPLHFCICIGIHWVVFFPLPCKKL